MMIVINKAFSALAAVLLISSFGCVSGLATGPLFRQIENADPKQSVIYFYYPYSTSPDKHGLSINGVLATRLDYGGYFSFVSPPGQFTFSLVGYEKINYFVELMGYKKSNYVLEAVAGHSYFIKVTGIPTGLGGSSRHYWLEEISESEALEEIKHCRLMDLPNEDECAGWKSGLILCQRTPHRR